MQFQAAACNITPDSLFCKALATTGVTLYKEEFKNKICGQTTISGDYEKYLEEFGGFTVGKCADQGFTHEDGSKTVNVPIIGDITVELYDSILGDGANDVTLFEIADGICGQSTLDKKYEKYAEEFAKL
jgi:hypothetical protein